MAHKLALFVALGVLAAAAPAATNTWLGSTSFDWFTPANWSENRVPDQEDVVLVPAGGMVIMNSNALFASLELHGALSGDVHVRTVLNWHSGDISAGGLTVHSNGLVNISKPGSLLELYGWCLNAGTLRKTAASQITVQGLALTNIGVIEVQAGTLELSSGLISSGTLSIAGNAAVLVREGVYDLAEGHRVIGNGTFAIVDNVEFQGALHDRLDWSSGRISGSLMIASNGVLNFAASQGIFAVLAPGTTVTNHGRVNFMKEMVWVWGADAVWHNAPSGVWDVDTLVDLGGTKLVNAGTIRVRSGRLDLRLDVEHHGRLEVDAEVNARGRFVSDGHIFVGPDAVMAINEGTLALREGHIVEGPGLFGFNEYTQNVQIEDWIYSRLDWAEGVVRGTIRIHSNAVLNLINPYGRYNHRLESPGAIVNYGTVNLFPVSDGMWDWEQNVTFYNTPGGSIEIGNLRAMGGNQVTLLNEGTIRCRSPRLDLSLNLDHHGRIEVLAGHLTVRGRLLSDGYVFVGPDTIMSVYEGVLALREGHTVEGPGLFGLDEGTYVQIEDWIYSRLDWADGVARGNIRIHSNAVLNLINPYGRYNHRLESPSAIVNYGTVNLFPVSDGMWEWGENVTFYNAPSGLIQIGRLGALGGTATTLLNEGIVRTTQAFNMDFFPRFTNAGMLELHRAAPRCVNGFVQTSAGSLALRLDNSGPLRLSVEGSAQLAGRLGVAVDPSLPLSPGTTIQIMNFIERIGEFQTFSGLGIAPGLRFNVLHQTTEVTLQVVVPQNRLSPPRLPQTDFTFTFDGDPDRPYQIQASTNLLHWDLLIATNSQTGTILFHDPSHFPRRFFRLQSEP